MKTTFHVADMVRPSCALRLEGLELSGVTRVSTSYAKLILEVDFDETQLIRKKSSPPPPPLAITLNL